MNTSNIYIPTAAPRAAGIAVLLLVTCGSTGCNDAPNASTSPAQPSFYRFTQDAADDPWAEMKMTLGIETRNGMFRRYSSRKMPRELDDQGRIELPELIEPEQLSRNAIGVLIAYSFENTPVKRGQINPNEKYMVRALPEQWTPADLEDLFVEIDNTGYEGKPIISWAQEILPATLSWDSKALTIPSKAVLRFAIGLQHSVLLPKPSRVEYTIELQQDAQSTLLYTETLDPGVSRDISNKWLDRAIHLSPYSGKTAKFRFTVRSIKADGQAEGFPPLVSPVLANPVLYNARPDPKTKKPNILMISLDTVRADHLGMYGYERDTTPNLDQFAAESVVFDWAIAPSSWTTPSHASVFTGLHPGQHGAGVESLGYHVDDKLTTLAELARKDGYQTAAFTEGASMSGGLGFWQGFEWYNDSEADRHYQTVERTIGRAQNWIVTHQHYPFFLYVHTYEAHANYMAPKAYWQRYTQREPAADMQLEAAKYKDDLADWYDAELAYLDQAMGGFFDWLDQQKLLDNTLVVVFSDHGEEFFEHGSVGHVRNLFDEVLHVPLIIRLPGGEHVTGRVPALVTTTDIFATVADWAGWDISDLAVRSKSLLPHVTGQVDPTAPIRQHVHSQVNFLDHGLFRNTGQRAEWVMDSLRSHDAKYLRTDRVWLEEQIASGHVPEPDDPRRFDEFLYDLEQDPDETRNVVDAHPQLVDDYRADLMKRLKEILDWREQRRMPQETDRKLTKEEIENLEALGYL